MIETFWAIVHMCLFPGGLFALSVGLFYKGIDRRVEARLQRRVGPPLHQPFLDVAKLFTKETLLPRTAQRTAFLLAPVLAFGSMLICAAFVPVAGVYEGLPHLADLLVIFYLLPVPAMALMLGGSASSSPFGAVGFSREMLLMLAYELPLLMILLTVAVFLGDMGAQAATPAWADFSLTSLLLVQQEQGALAYNPVLWPALIAYILYVPATLGVAPFDVAEAETEILEGPLLEYGGAPLAVFTLASALKTFVVLGLGVTLFFSGTVSDFWLVNLVWFLVKCVLLLILSVTLVKAASARYRIGQALGFFCKYPLLLALCSLLLVCFI